MAPLKILLEGAAAVRLREVSWVMTDGTSPYIPFKGGIRICPTRAERKGKAMRVSLRTNPFFS